MHTVSMERPRKSEYYENIRGHCRRHGRDTIRNSGSLVDAGVRLVYR